jgi:hypothetical protein
LLSFVYKFNHTCIVIEMKWGVSTRPGIWQWRGGIQ